MNHLYKRVVTVGMVSITALLAWIYCIVVYRDKPLYIAGISLVLIVSVYALLNTVMGLRAAKETHMQHYISETAANLMAQSASGSDNEDLIRLGKATYIQMRKLGMSIAQIQEAEDKDIIQRVQTARLQNDSLGLLTDSVIKTAKIIIKYNETNNTRLLEAIERINQDITAMRLGISASADENKDAVTAQLGRLLDELNVLKTSVTMRAGSPEEIAALLASEQAPSDDIADVIPFPSKEETASAPDPEPASFVNEPVNDHTDPEPIPAENNDHTDPEMIPAENNDDPNRQLSPDEIAALFASTAPSTSPEAKAEPVEEKSVPEPEMIPTKNNDDPNRQLSPDEIAALFASAAPSASPEAKAEPVEEKSVPEPEMIPTENNDNPNRQLSPDEIAALFASVKN